MEEEAARRAAAARYIKLGGVSEKSVQQLRALHLALFPVRYSDSFYSQLAEGGGLSQLAFFNDVLVGAACCRVEEGKLYIMTLGVLAPYRRLGIGSMLLRQVLHACASEPSPREIYLHVQTSNQYAIDFYKRFGFTTGDIVKDYYKRIDPPDAVVLHRLPPFPTLSVEEQPARYA